MSFKEYLKEMLSREKVSNLVKYVAVVSVDREEAKNPEKFLNINYAKNGEVEWEEPLNSSSIFVMKGKFLRDIYPKIKDKIGKIKFVDREKVEKEYDIGASVGAIKPDVEIKSFGKKPEELDLSFD